MYNLAVLFHHMFTRLLQRTSNEKARPKRSQHQLHQCGYCVHSPSLLYRRVKQDQNGCQNMDFRIGQVV